MNPHTSIWNKHKEPFIKDVKLYLRWANIKKHLTTTANIRLVNSTQLIINNCIIISKNSNKFRLLSQLDWAAYSLKDLAQAIDSNSLDSYYQQMLASSRSDPNVWKDIDKEHELKVHYAERAGRASKINPSLSTAKK